MHMTTTDLGMYSHAARKRGSGLTHDLLAVAHEHRGIFIATDHTHLTDIKRLIHVHDFNGVRVAVLHKNIIGIRGPVIFDHHALDMLFDQLEAEQRSMLNHISKLEKVNRELRLEVKSQFEVKR